jgi:hypothetical protein
VPVAAALRTAVEKARRGTGLTPRLAVVSAADPVDRSTGRLVHLPDAPFLLGELDPARILAPHVDGPVTVDNDVNWAAQAERDHARAAALDDFAYLFLGEGLGCAVVSDGRVRRGHAGLAGEIAHLITVGPRGQALPFIEVFSESSAAHGAAARSSWKPSPPAWRACPGPSPSGAPSSPATHRWPARESMRSAVFAPRSSPLSARTGANHRIGVYRRRRPISLAE